jgi:hypothetical protein
LYRKLQRPKVNTTREILSELARFYNPREVPILELGKHNSKRMSKPLKEQLGTLIYSGHKKNLLPYAITQVHFQCNMSKYSELTPTHAHSA